MKRATANRRGMTLVEVIVAMAILIIVAVFFASMFRVYYSVNQRTQEKKNELGGIETAIESADDAIPDGYVAVPKSPAEIRDPAITVGGKEYRIPLEVTDYRSEETGDEIEVFGYETP
jgi:prepilin-type N-terminal cleavage/methylation domain-containing protein